MYNLLNNATEIDLINLFNLFVKQLHYIAVNQSNIKAINEHFGPQYSNDYLYHFIDYFDYIIIYNKNNFEQNIYQLLVEFKIKGIIDNIDYYWNHWGYYQNETLFSEYTTHSNTVSDEQESKLLKKYYGNKDTLFRAFTMFKYDYMLLPFQYPPIWMIN